MKKVTIQRLTKIALALTLAGYCSAPVLAANKTSRLSQVSKVGSLQSGNGWQTSSNTGSIIGTVPKIKLPGAPATDDGLHVKVDIDRGSRTVSSDGDKQFHVGDKVTVSWEINDTEGDTDDATTPKTKGSIKWMCYKDQSKTEWHAIDNNGLDSYTIKKTDENCYIGLQITPETVTGDPRQGVLVDMADLSTAAGGGSDSDDIPEGPVVDDDLNVTIYDKDNTTVNLLKDSSVKLQTGHTYKVKLWRDTNGNDKYDDGVDTDVTSYYDYQWVFTGASATAGTSGDSSVTNEDLLIPVTNADAKTSVLSTAGADGVQGNTLAVKYKRK